MYTKTLTNWDVLSVLTSIASFMSVDGKENLTNCGDKTKKAIRELVNRACPDRGRPGEQNEEIEETIYKLNDVYSIGLVSDKTTNTYNDGIFIYINGVRCTSDNNIDNINYAITNAKSRIGDEDRRNKLIKGNRYAIDILYMVKRLIEEDGKKFFNECKLMTRREIYRLLRDNCEHNKASFVETFYLDMSEYEVKIEMEKNYGSPVPEYVENMHIYVHEMPFSRENDKTNDVCSIEEAISFIIAESKEQEKQISAE